MKPEKMMDAIGGISDKYVEKYAVVEPARHDRLHFSVIQHKLVHRFRACAAVLALAFGIGILAINAYSKSKDFPLLNNITLVPSVNISSYVFTNTGTLTEQQLSFSVETPISIVESVNHLNGLLFSVDSANKNTPPTITILTADTCEQKSCELFKLFGVEFAQGKSYFFFVGQSAEDFEDLAFHCLDEKATSSFEVLIAVSENSSGYSAKLQSISSSNSKQKP